MEGRVMMAGGMRSILILILIYPNFSDRRIQTNVNSGASGSISSMSLKCGPFALLLIQADLRL